MRKRDQYKTIMEREAKKLPLIRNWWPYYFYHYSDVTNVVSILRTGMLYSRSEALNRNLMATDNASEAVIQITNDGIEQMARLYFRPKTPTQYHNEGYKPPSARYQSIDACCPVPVFLLFDAARMLEDPSVFFSDQTLAGMNPGELMQGIEDFDKLPFDLIYHEGYFDGATKHDIIRRRHAEIAIKGGLDINRYFKGVICRSNTERKTLLYLLRQVDLRLYEKYKNKIATASINNPYYGNGIYIEDVYYNQQEIEILFNSPNCRQFAHSCTHDTIISTVKLKWYSQEKKLENVNTHDVPIYYDTTERLKIKLPQIYSDYIELTVYLDDRLMCCYVIDFTDIHILG